MKVDLAAALIAEDEPRWQSRHRGWVVRESERLEERSRRMRIAPRDHHIDVVVLARLLAEEGVDAPAAVQPRRERRERVEHLECVGGGQTTSAGVGSSNSAGAVSE